MDKTDLRKERRRIQNRESQRRFRERHRLRQAQVANNTDNLRTRTRRIASPTSKMSSSITPQVLIENSHSFGSAKSDGRRYDAAAGIWSPRRGSQRSTYSPSTTGQMANSIEATKHTLHVPVADQLNSDVHVRLTNNEPIQQCNSDVDPRVWPTFDEETYSRGEDNIARDRPYTFISPEPQSYPAPSHDPGHGLMFPQHNQIPFPPWTSLPVSFATNANSKYTTTLYINR